MKIEMFHSEVELLVWGCGGGRVGVSCGSLCLDSSTSMSHDGGGSARFSVDGWGGVCRLHG
jgi:hypothetical protein